MVTCGAAGRERGLLPLSSLPGYLNLLLLPASETRSSGDRPRLTVRAPHSLTTRRCFQCTEPSPAGGERPVAGPQVTRYVGGGARFPTPRASCSKGGAHPERVAPPGGRTGLPFRFRVLARCWGRVRARRCQAAPRSSQTPGAERNLRGIHAPRLSDSDRRRRTYLSLLEPTLYSGFTYIQALCKWSSTLCIFCSLLFMLNLLRFIHIDNSRSYF